MSSSRKSSKGFAFINFIDEELAREFIEAFQGRYIPGFEKNDKTQPLEVCIAEEQGVGVLIAKFKTVLESEVSCPEYQPLFFDRETGEEMAYPTKTMLLALNAVSKKDPVSDKFDEMSVNSLCTTPGTSSKSSKSSRSSLFSNCDISGLASYQMSTIESC
jgi:RNA recognition motif-containing protein